MSDGAAQAMGSPAPSPGGGAWWPRFAILLVVLLAWLPGLATLPPLDRDESRFAEASRQMVETGNFVDIRFAGTTRYNKPIGIYWLQAASAALAGPAMRDRIFVYRLPSLLAGFLCLLMVYECGRRLGMRHRALFASLLLGTTLLLVAESDIATTDAALLATVIAAQLTMMRTYLSVRDSRYAKPGLARIMGGWAALGAGVLLKGPVILAVVGATALALSLWDREWRWLRSLRPLSGILVAAAIVAPWAIAIGYASHGAFYQQSLGHDFAAKILGGEESHGAPPGYYLALASFTFWPATLLLLPALADAVGQRRDPVYRYLLAWSGSVWLMFEFVPTKLPHYILPVWPALALLCALWIGRASIAKSMRGQTWLRAAGAAQFGLGAIGLVAASLYLPPHNGGSLEWPALVAAALVLAWGCAAILFLLRQHYERAAVLAVASAVLFYLLLGFAIVPQLHELWLSPRAAELVVANRRPGDPPPVIAGFVEPSLVFALGSGTRIEPASKAAEAAAAQGGLALVDGRAQQIFLRGISLQHAAAKPLGEVSGVDYSTGRPERLTLFRVSGIAGTPAGRSN